MEATAILTPSGGAGDNERTNTRWAAGMDNLTAAERSERMSRVRWKDTRPELIVRRLVHSMGYRYRLHKRELPGSPDLVFAGRRKVIFVHGCFWHRHGCPSGRRLPKSRLDFWQPKLESNKRRDLRTKRELERLGWAVLTLWECETKDTVTLSSRIRAFLDAS